MNEYPFTISDADGNIIDRAGNVESTESVLYGDLSRHDGRPRTVYAPTEREAERLRYAADINADCWGIPLDIVTGPDARCGRCDGRGCDFCRGF